MIPEDLAKDTGAMRTMLATDGDDGDNTSFDAMNLEEDTHIENLQPAAQNGLLHWPCAVWHVGPSPLTLQAMCLDTHPVYCVGFELASS
jgi:hypothetical protein